MHEKDSAEDEGPALVSNTTMEIVVALLLLGGSAIVIYDSVKLGFGWQEGVGPAPGSFPFWVSVILGVSSLAILATAIFNIISGATARRSFRCGLSAGCWRCCCRASSTWR